MLQMHKIALILQYKLDNCLSTYKSMVIAPQSANVSIDTIRGYFNAYLMHKMYVEHLVVNLSASDLLDREWVKASTAKDVHKNFTKLLAVINYNIKNLAQLVSSY